MAGRLWADRSGFDFLQEEGIWASPSLLSKRIRGLFDVGKADHSPPSSAEVQNAWSYTSTVHTSSWREA